MSTDLATTSIPVVPSKYDDRVNELLGGSGFLPRVQLFIANSDMVKSGAFPMNHYGFVARKDQVEDLGKEVDVLLIHYRPLALDSSDRSNIRASYDMSTPLFEEIRKKSFIKDSGCQFGPQYLIWVPSKAAFATFYMGGVTTRNEARNVHQFLGKPITLKSRLIKTDKYSYQSPICTPCTTPFDLPSDEERVKAVEDFANVQDRTGAEPVNEEETPTRDR